MQFDEVAPTTVTLSVFIDLFIGRYRGSVAVLPLLSGHGRNSVQNHKGILTYHFREVPWFTVLYFIVRFVLRKVGSSLLSPQ